MKLLDSCRQTGINRIQALYSSSFMNTKSPKRWIPSNKHPAGQLPHEDLLFPIQDLYIVMSENRLVSVSVSHVFLFLPDLKNTISRAPTRWWKCAASLCPQGRVIYWCLACGRIDSAHISACCCCGDDALRQGSGANVRG